MRQKRILLAFVETMHFVNKYQGWDMPLRHRHTCFFNDFADFFDTAEDCRNRNKGKSESIGHETSKCRLSHSGRPPENHRMRSVRFKSHPQRLPRPQQLFLTDHFIYRLRAHAFGQRRELIEQKRRS